MKYRVTTIDCDEEYGEERVIVEDEQLGAIKIHEMEIDSLEEVHELLDESDAVQFEECLWSRYDGEMTIICGDLF